MLWRGAAQTKPSGTPRPAVAADDDSFRWCLPVMSLRLRKLFGAVALFVLVTLWALLAMALAQMPAIREHAVISIAYYVVAGLGWVLPAMPIVAWMSRKPTRP
jgi:Protein of unknown function (DUF2842)